MPGIRKLNETGIQRLAEWVAGGAIGALPLILLNDPETSEPLAVQFRPDTRRFQNRFEFGLYLSELLAPTENSALIYDRGLWTALALFWFDQLCPADTNGNRKIEKYYRYILSADFRHYYRHLVRSPWQLVRDHAANARFLLLAGEDGAHPLRRHGEILEQLGGRQAVLRSKPVIAEASLLYADPATGRPRKGVAGSGRGSVRRLALVLQQFDLTFDADSMEPGALNALLPKEFDRWKADATAETKAA